MTRGDVRLYTNLFQFRPMTTQKLFLDPSHSTSSCLLLYSFSFLQVYYDWTDKVWVNIFCRNQQYFLEYRPLQFTLASNISCFAMWLFVPMKQSSRTLHHENKLISLSLFWPNRFTLRFLVNSLYILHWRWKTGFVLGCLVMLKMADI